MKTRRRLLAAGSLAMLLVAAACGDDDDGGAAAPATQGASETSSAVDTTVAPETSVATETSGAVDTTVAPASSVATEAPAPADTTPIKVGFVNLEGGAVSLPELRLGTETAAEYVNANGGVNGRPLEIIPCNVDGTPEKSIDCANKLVGDGVHIVMEGYDPSSDAMLPVLESAGVALTGHAAFGPQQQESDAAFFFGTANPSFTAGFLDYYVNTGAESMMMFLPDNAAFRASADSVMHPIAESLSFDVKTTFYNPSSPNWAALATTALTEAPDVVGTVAPDGDCLGLLGALRAIDYQGEIFLGACTLFLVADPAGAVGVSTTADLWKPTDLDAPPADKREQLQLYIDTMTEAGHQDLINGFAGNFFSDTINLAAVLALVDGEVTPAAIADAFRATKNLDSFMGPTISCDHSAWPGQSACGNQVLLYKVEDGGVQTAITPEFIDTSKYISVLA